METWSTPVATGTQTAYVVVPVTWTAGDTDVVMFCEEWWAGIEHEGYCLPAPRQQVPPQEVEDLLDGGSW